MPGTAVEHFTVSNNGVEFSVEGDKDAQLTIQPVSYTHLDVYKRQIYIQLRNQIIIGIATETIKEGDPLPSVRQKMCIRDRCSTACAAGARTGC